MKIIVIWFALVLSTVVQANPLNKIVVFGDSLSDNGNMYELMQQMFPPSPPYYKGRFTNGPVWIEDLAESVYPKQGSEHLLDYAFGGAAIADDDNPLVLSLKLEMDMYFSVHDDKADENSLYIIWIGANNYIKLPQNVEENLAKVNAGIKQGAQRLINAGAKHIMLVNLPDLGVSPLADEVVFDDPPDLARKKLSHYTERHNQLLASLTNDLMDTNPGIQLLLFDAYSELYKILNESGLFSNVTESCYATKIGKFTLNTTLEIASKINNSNETGKVNCDGYIFFDAVHPTAPAHAIVADRVRLFLKQNGVDFARAEGCTFDE